MRSQTIIYPNPKPNQKNLKFGLRIPNPNYKNVDSRNGRLSVALLLGLGIVDSALYLNQLKKTLLQNIHNVLHLLDVEWLKNATTYNMTC